MNTNESDHINELLNKLKNIPNVRNVEVIYNNSNDDRDITFKLFYNAESEERIKIKEIALNLVIDYEWKLRDITKSEDWHFNATVAWTKL